MNALTINCAKCRSRFSLDQGDREFYSRLGLSEPTLCPDCRVQRRMVWRNDRSFYIRKSDLSGKQIVSIYPPQTPFPVYHPNEWYGDLWDPFEFGREVQLNSPFFPQWHKLMLTVPRLGIDIVNCENSDYCNYCGDDKNCYLDIAGEANEECFYNLFTKFSKQCVDCTFVYNSELCYESISCYRCYEVWFSSYLDGCSSCYFSFDLKGCQDCLFCWNLRQQRYCIFNQQLTEKEYRRELAKYGLNSFSGVSAAKDIYNSTVLEKAVHRDIYALNSVGCTGNDIKDSKNCERAFNISNCEDSKFLYDVLDAKTCYDLNYSLYNPECSCELISTLNMKFSAFCMASHYCSESFYCDLCNNSSNLFGCIGLNRQQYCILNRQYSAEDYHTLKDKIVASMKAAGEWGEFFPASLSPFGYNETVADEYFPLSKEEANRSGFSWCEKAERGLYDGSRTALPDKIEESGQDLVSKVLICEQSQKPYKVILPELKFYQKNGIPIPRRAPDQRHRDRMALRNLRNLWDRKCDSCGTAIISSYPPKGGRTVYCERCYQRAIYG